MSIDYSIIGKRFGRLVVVELDHLHKKTTFWKCQCDCGNEYVVSRNSLTAGYCISCGCYRKDHKSEFSKKHGLSNSRIYQIWSGIVQRCTNPNAQNFPRYGGRGIKVCENWKNDFQSFYSWSIANGYEEGLTIERIDNNGNYEPHNCRWATKQEQYNNTRRTRKVTYNGIEKTLSEWSRLLCVNHETLRYRVTHGNYKDFHAYFITGGDKNVGTQQANATTKGA